MRTTKLMRLWPVLAVLLLLAPPVLGQGGQGGNDSFGFNGSASGFPTGAVDFTGGGVYKLPSFIRAGGSFKCTANVAQGPLSGCAAGQGVRWDAVALLASTTFRCVAGEPLKTVVTDDNTVVMIADFYREADGEEASFTARMFVSAVDERPDLSGDQKVWIQAVGCGDAIANFN